MTINRWAEASNSEYIAATEFGGKDVTLTIKDLWVEKGKNYDGEPCKNLVVAFAETERKWIANATNRARMTAIWPDPKDAIGRRITLMSAESSKSPTGVAIRVKGSPDLAGDTVTLDPLGQGKTRKFTLVKTQDKSTPAPEPIVQDEEPHDGGLDLSDAPEIDF